MEEAQTSAFVRQVKERFAQLVDLPAVERDRWLREECDTPELRRELQALLDADAHAESVMSAVGEGIAGLLESAFPPTLADEGLPRPGSAVSHYRVLAPIGRGGMGIVLRARDPRLERDVALKLLPPDALPSADAKRRLLREARAAAALDHPNICTVYDIGESADGGLFIAMAYCEGETLAQRLERGPLESADAANVFLQLCAGLAAAHAAGILHCDVKPSNVILTPAGTVKLVDFGIARLPAEHTQDGAVRGTLGYMAPEQLRGEAIDARADVWALGVVLYECLTGLRPFRVASEVAAVHGTGGAVPPALPATIDDWERWQEIVARCLAPRRDDRFEDAAALVHAIGAISDPLMAARPLTHRQRRAAAPLPPTKLIGRATELGVLEDALRSARLVTISGTAGTGKTRLALEAYHLLANRFPDGAFFVSLAAVTDSARVASEIAGELGLVDQPARSPVELLCEHVGEQEILLVLDNFEQVVAAALVVATLLARCANLRILVTSRVALRVRGEQELPLEPLRVPPEGDEPLLERLETYPATALFLERARAVRPDLRIEHPAAAEIVSICRHLDGLPLAIELAAAQLRVLPPAAVRERLTRRLEALTDGARDLPPRHRTLRDAIEWSFHLLPPDERRTFRRAGVFAGGTDLQALEQVCGARPGGTSLLSLVGTLVEHSLLRPTPGIGGRPRFAMLETIREYALERLSTEEDAVAIRLQHAEHFLTLAETGAKALSGPDQAFWLDRLEEEHDNLRAALSWAEANGHNDTALRIGAALCRFWIARGHVREGLERMTRLRRMRTDPHLRMHRAAVLAGAGSLAHETGDFRGARPLLEEALSLYRDAGDELRVAMILNTLAWIHAHVGPLDHAESVAREALQACQAIGDSASKAVALHNLAWIAVYRGLPEPALAHANEAIAIRERLGDRRGAAFTLANRARAERLVGDLESAFATLAPAHATARELHDRQLLALVRMVEGQVLLEQEDVDAAALALARALDLWREVRHDFAAGDCLNWLAATDIALGRFSDADARLAEATSIWERIGGPWGRAATLFRFGQLARRTGRPDAGDLLRQSLALRREIGDIGGEADCLEELAAHAVESADHQSRAGPLADGEALTTRPSEGMHSVPAPPP